MLHFVPLESPTRKESSPSVVRSQVTPRGSTPVVKPKASPKAKARSNIVKGPSTFPLDRKNKGPKGDKITRPARLKSSNDNARAPSR